MVYLWVLIVARSAVRLAGSVVQVPATCRVNGFESRVCYFVFRLHFTFNSTAVLVHFFVGRLGLVGLGYRVSVSFDVYSLYIQIAPGKKIARCNGCWRSVAENDYWSLERLGWVR